MVAPRDIFTTRELNQLTQAHWTNPRAKMMFLLARYTGMRNGELRALKIKSVHKNYIDISTAYNNADGLKTTKNGKNRRFPISPSLYNQILRYISTLPDTKSSAYLFPNLSQPHIPVGTSFANTHLTLQMKKLGIPKTRLEGTFIVTRTFHSLRHCMDTFLTTRTTLPITTISKLMGHSPKMVQHYSNHYSDEIFRLAARTLSHSDLWTTPRKPKNTPRKNPLTHNYHHKNYKERTHPATGLPSFAVLRGSSLTAFGTKGFPVRARRHRQNHRFSASHT